MRCRPTAIRCVVWLPRLGACCSRWHPRDSACRSRSSRSATASSSVAADPSKRVTYGELIGGRKFNVTLTGEQHRRHDRRGASSRTSISFKIVGQSPQRYDIPAEGGRLAASGRWM